MVQLTKGQLKDVISSVFSAFNNNLIDTRNMTKPIKAKSRDIRAQFSHLTPRVRAPVRMLISTP